MAEGKDEGTHGLLFKSRAEKHRFVVCEGSILLQFPIMELLAAWTART
jgi:hypothetical protein